MSLSGLGRPEPASRSALSDDLRTILLRSAAEGLSLRGSAVPGLSPIEVWGAYTSEQLIPPQFDNGLAEVGRRYSIPGLDQRLYKRLREYVEQTAIMGLAPYPDRANEQLRDAAHEIGAQTALELLPDQEFLTAFEDAANTAKGWGDLGRQRADHMMESAERLFRKYGLPYAVKNGTITWSGDKTTSETILEPALAALEDPRVSGARDEFRRAQQHLRAGTPGDLRDAAHEAGNAVEAVLQALIAAHGLKPPRSKTAAPLFNMLRDAGKLPAALESTVMAAAQVRNAQGGHTQGAIATDADRRLAESAVRSSATAITVLVGYLPS